MDMEIEEEKICPMCQHIGYFLGKLGAKEWWRCRGCGIDFSAEAKFILKEIK